MALPATRILIGSAMAAAFAFAGPALAQTAPQGSAPAQPRPAFCLVNALEGLPVTAEIRAGKAATKIQIPPGQNACCVKFCAENPAPSGYQVSMTAQPAGTQAAGAKAQQLCKVSLVTGKVLRVSGSAAQARCDEARL